MAQRIPSLPELKNLLPSVIVDGMTGFIISKLNQVNSKLMIMIFVIRAVCDTIFYHFARFAYSNSDKMDENILNQRFFIVTTFVVNLSFLIISRNLNLIGDLFTSVLGGALIGQVINRVNYIQNAEKMNQNKAGVSDN